MTSSNEIPGWVTPGAKVVIVRNGRTQTAGRRTILRVGKKYAILDNGTRFDVNRQGHNGCLTRYGPGAWDSESLYPEGHDTARAVLTAQAIGDNGRRLTRVVEAFIQEPTEERAARARSLISSIRTLTVNATERPPT